MAACVVQCSEITSEVDEKWGSASLNVLLHHAKTNVAQKWRVAKYVPKGQNDRNGEACVSLSNDFGPGYFCIALNPLLKLIVLAPRRPSPKKTNLESVFWPIRNFLGQNNCSVEHSPLLCGPFVTLRHTLQLIYIPRNHRIASRGVNTTKERFFRDTLYLLTAQLVIAHWGKGGPVASEWFRQIFRLCIDGSSQAGRTPKSLFCFTWSKSDERK